MRHRAIEGDEAKAAEAVAKSGKTPNDTATMMKAVARAYDSLADSVETTAGYTGEPVKKVAVDALRKKLVSMGVLETDDGGLVTSSARKSLSRAKSNLIMNNTFVEKDRLLWRITEGR
jgi:hypothetical protein